MDVVNLATANGNFGGITSPMLMERLTTPALMSIDESVIQFWVLLSGQAGGSYTINIYRPDQSLFGTRFETLTRKRLWTWKHHAFSFRSHVSAADIGTWRMEAVVNDTVIYSRTMEVGFTSEYAPRFYPVAGRSFHVEGGEIRDTLRLSQFSNPSIYGLMNAPDFVSMAEDSIVIIEAGAILAQRSVYFQIEATDDAGRTDTMWYHLIDVNRPLSCAVARTGDVDVNAQITSADIIGSVNYVFKGGAAPLPCEASADVNCSGAVTSADVIFLVNHVFKGGPTPCDVCTIIPGSWACP